MDKQNSAIRLLRNLEEALAEAFEAQVTIPNPLRRYLFSLQTHAKKLYEAVRGEDESQIDQVYAAIQSRAADLQASLAKGFHSASVIGPLNKVLNAATSEDFILAPKTALLLPEDVIKWSEHEKYETSLSVLHHDLRQVQIMQAEIWKRTQNIEQITEQGGVSARALAEEVAKAKEKANASVTQVINELLSKQSEVNELVGLISGTAVSGSYAKSAETEKQWADSTRNGSVFLMLTAVLIIGYSLLETATPHFEWQVGLFRLLFSLALSVPAVYLARESTKHRGQQYSYLRMSLDLQSITPYLASLPEAEQHRLKAEMASRLFGGKDIDVQQIESYPLNVQELVIALASKISEPPKPK